MVVASACILLGLLLCLTLYGWCSVAYAVSPGGNQVAPLRIFSLSLFWGSIRGFCDLALAHASAIQNLTSKMDMRLCKISYL